MENVFIFSVLIAMSGFASKLLIPMDDTQKNHMKSYGAAFWVLQHEVTLEWLLNYRGGSFMMPYSKDIESELVIRGITYLTIADAQATAIKQEIANPEVNMEVVKLEKAPKIAVYSPKGKQPWDDAVTLVLTYAEIPYTVIYDDEIIGGELHLYDWLHLHHEDFTGQYCKFYGFFRNAPWYKAQVKEFEETAERLGFSKVSELKLGVALKIKEYTAGGGFVSTSEDLLLFGNEIIKPSIVSKNIIKDMVTPLQISNGKSTQYGIGIGVTNVKNNTLRYSHSGGGMGATSYLLIYPEKEMVISILTNLSGVGIRKIVNELEDVFIE